MEPDAYCFHKDHEPSGPRELRLERHYLLYAMSGTLRLQAEGSRWTLPPARAALIAAGHPMTLSVLSRIRSASVMFAPGFVPEPARPVTVFEVSPLARELIAECRVWGPESGPLSPYAGQIFRTLATVVWQLAERPSRCVLPMPSSPPLIRALALTEERAGDAITFEEIARAAGQSPRALTRRFAEEMGMSWGQVLRRIRIMRAVEALASGNAPVTEIALSVGYNSLSAFNAAFRDLLGTSPSGYRRSFRC
jgi:AraC-like DNA-binding protein